MGARVGRMFRNFNLENRVHREIAKEKPRLAPRHAVTEPQQQPPAAAATSGEAAVEEAVNRKDDPLLALLRSVYVDSTDPAPAEATKQVTSVGGERRPLKFHLPASVYGLAELTDVPVGKLTIGEALKALSSHRRQPETWTPEKIALDYALDLKEAKSILEFFIPFQVEIIPPKDQETKQIKAS
ncbi:NADH dehydrogenase [ubiquinone] 1 alpha subcomplex assembly factor 4 [Nelusetta ayraudi]|uniref:NADH dehydrogenase [ubiquinone] 1 alpha subcomplex assembly factor 4 n=1 Tax=Nelusetta ayraudi TaxID=303726 RepID=UPI003F713FEF